MLSNDELREANEFHTENGCRRVIGPRGGVKTEREVWRRNGQTKTWVRDTQRIEVPIKYGFRGPYSTITQHDRAAYHASTNCPLDKTPADQPWPPVFDEVPVKGS